MKKPLINLLLIFSCQAFAGDLATSFGTDAKNNLTFSISNHNPSESIVLKSFQVKADNHVCLFKDRSIKLLPQQYTVPETINIQDCLKLNRNAEFSGITDASNSLAVIPGHNLLKKDLTVKINYNVGSSTVIESEPTFSLLFIQK